ncbi:OmpA family protein [Chitinophaga sp. XS-30]|uniref:OmpA family protein n=1 Tax=Chitinophaga sp. XS-30 TaxID=2604421 RepID=UPI001AEFB520|nr:OmpA family protein [Chitinophaga sp. XS-30]
MMKQQMISLAVAVLALTASSCNNQTRQPSAAEESGEKTVAATEEKKQPAGNDPAGAKTFDINTIPVSDKEIGEFPFFNFPEGLKATNRPIQRKYDVLYFPIDGVMTPIEGKVWKTYVSIAKGSDDEWSLPYFLKSYDEAIAAVGGVKIFDGKITNEEYERYHDQAEYLGEDGSIGYVGQRIVVYVIRRSDGRDVYIQMAGNTASGNLNILQKEGFKQTITMMKSDQIQQALDEKGKAVLYINFDVDKSTLKPDGKDAVAEIRKVLESTPSLKIAINGYTDNTGDDAHNKRLSNDRANTVMQALVAAGIDKARLSAEGFGSQNPLADNSSEEGKAKNRRVELVKM